MWVTPKDAMSRIMALVIKLSFPQPFLVIGAPGMGLGQ